MKNKILVIFTCLNLINCKKESINCSFNRDKVSIYMDKLTRAKQSQGFKIIAVKNSISEEVKKLQDSTNYFYEKLYNCDTTNYEVLKDYRDFLFLNNRRLQSLKYSNIILKNPNLSEYDKDRILCDNFYVYILSDSLKYKNEIRKYYNYSKNFRIDVNRLNSNDNEYRSIVLNKIIAKYYFEGYDSAFFFLKKYNQNFTFIDLWQEIENFQPLDIYRRKYDFDRPNYFPQKNPEKSKNYIEMKNAYEKYGENIMKNRK